MKRIFMWLISPFFGDYQLQYRTERNEFIWRVLLRVVAVCAFIAAIQYLFETAKGRI